MTVPKSEGAIGFEVVPNDGSSNAWLAWISCCRRLTRDFECYARTVAAFIRLAMTRIMLKRSTKLSVK